MYHLQQPTTCPYHLVSEPATMTDDQRLERLEQQVESLSRGQEKMLMQLTELFQLIRVRKGISSSLDSGLFVLEKNLVELQSNMLVEKEEKVESPIFPGDDLKECFLKADRPMVKETLDAERVLMLPSLNIPKKQLRNVVVMLKKKAWWIGPNGMAQLVKLVQSEFKQLDLTHITSLIQGKEEKSLSFSFFLLTAVTPTSFAGAPTTPSSSAAGQTTEITPRVPPKPPPLYNETIFTYKSGESVIALFAQFKHISLQHEAATIMVVIEIYGKRFKYSDIVATLQGLAGEEKGQTNVNVLRWLCLVGERIKFDFCCGNCRRLFVQGHYCLVCLKIYRDSKSKIGCSEPILDTVAKSIMVGVDRGLRFLPNISTVSMSIPTYVNISGVEEKVQRVFNMELLVIDGLLLDLQLNAPLLYLWVAEIELAKNSGSDLELSFRAMLVIILIMHQKLEGGNLALEGRIHYEIEVRVVRGIKYKGSLSPKVYICDGLYAILDCWADVGTSSFGVYKHNLVRIDGQPEIGSSVLRFAETLRTRPTSVRPMGYLSLDMSNKKENVLDLLFNDIDSDHDPLYYDYLVKNVFPPVLNQGSGGSGCDCVSSCTVGCLCAKKTEGELVYDNSGSLLRRKCVIFECGKFCKCLPNCQNHVSKKGLSNKIGRFHWEIEADFRKGFPYFRQAVQEALLSRDQILGMLKKNLQVAAKNMKSYHDKGHVNLDLNAGDMVYLRLPPYNQSFASQKTSQKSSPRFYGPFQVLECIGKLAYRIKLLEGNRVQPVFHFSLLRKKLGPDVLTDPSMPAWEPLLLAAVFWKYSGKSADKATWEDTNDSSNIFHLFQSLRTRILLGMEEMMMTCGYLVMDLLAMVTW